MIRLELKDRRGETTFIANIDCSDDSPKSQKLMLTVLKAIEKNINWAFADQKGADLGWPDPRGKDMSYTGLTDAVLIDASLRGTIGDCIHIKSMQIGGYDITYTHDRLQIGCQNHSHDQWRDFDDKAILKMDGKKALTFWKKYKDLIFQTIAMSPATSTGRE